MKKSLKIVPVVLLVLTVCLAQAQNQSGNTADDSSISSNDDGWNFTAAP